MRSNAMTSLFSDTSLIPMVAVSRFASQKVKVALSGDGSDELFGGYITYKADKIKKWLDIFPFFARKLSAKIFNTCAIESSRKMNFGFKIRQFSKGLPGDFRRAHYAWRELFTLKERVELIGRHKKEEIYQTDPFRRFQQYYDEVRDLDNLSQHQYVDVKTWLADDILVKVNRAAMACSLETRCPYLDAELVEYAAAIPSYFKQRKFTGKYILKKQFENILPSKIINKKKSGFNAPVNVWLGRSRENEYKTFNRYVYAQKELINHE